MDLLKAVALSAALLAPAVAAAQDLSARDLAPMALESYTTPPANIKSAKVFDQRGHMVGSVKGIATDAAGKPDAISIQPADGQPLMVVGAGDASYDQAHNIVVTAVEPQGIASAK
jgi:hypothetical protein